MAAIASIAASGVIGVFGATESTLTASDTITVAPGKCQLLALRNPTAGSLTVAIKGADVTTASIPGYGGAVSLAAGYQITLAANEQKAVILSTISLYLQGVVSITGGTGIKAQLFDI